MMNPILPPTVFIPDGEPHIFELNGEKRLFLYGSRDERITAFCGYGHDVWSAPLSNLNQWTCHGEIFNVKQVQEIGYGIIDEQHFGAPDCVYNPITGKYYLYTFLGKPYYLDGLEGPKKDTPDTVPGFGDFGPKCIVAQSDSPIGPFVEPIMCDWPAKNNAGTFDPTALVEEQEDGSIRVYVYWGMKAGGDRCAEVDPTDMHTIINPETRKPDRNAWRKTLPLPEKINGSTLFEANSIKKLGKDKYAFIYSANERNSALTYCYGNSPFGPWHYGGRIIDASQTWKYGNNHGSIVKVNDQWYVFYHRPSTNCYNRQAMMEPIEVSFIDDQVEIPTVGMTSQGCDVNGLDAFCRYNIGTCCSRTGIAYIDGAQRRTDGLNPMMGITKPYTVLGFKYLNFGKKRVVDADGCTLKLNLRLIRNTVLTIQVATAGTEDRKEDKITLAEFNLKDYIAADGEYHEVILLLNGLDSNQRLTLQGGLSGKQAVFFRFESKLKRKLFSKWNLSPNVLPKLRELCRVKEYEFCKENN